MNKTEPCDVTFEAAGRFFLIFFSLLQPSKGRARGPRVPAQRGGSGNRKGHYKISQQPSLLS